MSDETDGDIAMLGDDRAAVPADSLVLGADRLSELFRISPPE